jgi:hypothetical protein
MTEPPPDIPEIPAPIRALVLAETPRSFTLWVFQAWKMAGNVEHQMWAPHLAEGMAPDRPHSPGLPPLTQAPRPEDLGDVRLLYVDDFDPNGVPPAFWERVAERVRGGTLGLWLRPGTLHGEALLSHPALRPILPIASSEAIKGDPPPGVFADERPFAVTERGIEHPASRITGSPKWSREKWAALARGEKKWGTKFAYPFREVGPRASVLLEVEPPRGGNIPALVLSDPTDGRVLVAGFFDFGRDPYYDGGRSWDVFRSLVLQWTVWLAPA